MSLATFPKPLIAALAIGLFASLCGSAAYARTADDGYRDLTSGPDDASVVTEAATTMLVRGDDNAWSAAGIKVTTVARADGLHVGLSAPDAAVKKHRLRWRGKAEPGSGWKYLGDAWERSYGDLEWRPMDAGRIMPWYVLASDGRHTHAYGVMTQPAALCCWKLDEEGVTLLADVRCGGAGVQLGSRTLAVCTIASRHGVNGESPFAAASAFCRQLCPRPRLPRQPVYGFNNWYCDYGKSTADSVRQDTAFLARLAPRGEN